MISSYTGFVDLGNVLTITITTSTYDIPPCPQLCLREELDERYNPKMWAKWFQEFLYELYGQFSGALDIAYVPRHCFRRPVKRRVPLKREWIFKDWVQKLGDA